MRGNLQASGDVGERAVPKWQAYSNSVHDNDWSHWNNDSTFHNSGLLGCRASACLALSPTMSPGSLGVCLGGHFAHLCGFPPPRTLEMA